MFGKKESTKISIQQHQIQIFHLKFNKFQKTNAKWMKNSFTFKLLAIQGIVGGGW